MHFFCFQRNCLSFLEVIAAEWLIDRSRVFIDSNCFLSPPVCCVADSSGVQEVRFEQSNSHDFDVLIFTQRWPITFCAEWMESNPDHVCVLPSQKDVWTIHGIWPTRFGSIGPSFCNKTAKFNVHELDPFISQLEQFWLNIEKGSAQASNRLKSQNNLVHPIFRASSRVAMEPRVAQARHLRSRPTGAREREQVLRPGALLAPAVYNVVPARESQHPAR